MVLIKVEGYLHRSRDRNMDRSFSYFFRRRVPIFENGVRKYQDRKAFLGHDRERASVECHRMSAEVDAELRGEAPKREASLSVRIREYLNERASQKGWSNIRANLSQMLEFLQDRPIRKVLVRELEQYSEHLKAKTELAAVTVNSKLADVRQFFRNAHLLGFVDVDPAIGLKGAKVTQREYTLPNMDQIRQLLRTCKPWMADILQVLLMSGARPAEVLRLEFSTVDFSGHRLTLMRTKNVDNRAMPHEIVMPKRLEDLLGRIHLERGMPVDGLVFVNGNGRPYTVGQVYIPFKRLVRKLGMPWLTLKTFRKVAGTEIQERTSDMRVAQDQLGHSRIATTERYLIRKRAVKLKAAGAIEEMMNELVGDAGGDFEGAAKTSLLVK